MLTIEIRSDKHVRFSLRKIGRKKTYKNTRHSSSYCSKVALCLAPDISYIPVVCYIVSLKYFRKSLIYIEPPAECVEIWLQKIDINLILSFMITN